MKLGVSMWSYVHAWKAGRLDIAGFIHEAKKIGAEGVELLDFFYKDVENDRIAIQKALEETELPCCVFSISQNFAKPDELDRRAELGKIKFGVDEAVRYGAGIVRVFAGDVPADGSIDFGDAREWIIEGLTLACQYAEEKSVKLALENHGKLAGRADQVRDLVLSVRERSGSNTLGANPDTGNFVLVDQVSDTAIRDVADLAYMVHFKDFTKAPEGHEGFAYQSLGGEKYVGAAVGEGVVNLGACLAELKRAHFKGFLNVEYEADEDPFTGVARSLENARALM